MMKKVEVESAITNLIFTNCVSAMQAESRGRHMDTYMDSHMVLKHVHAGIFSFYLSLDRSNAEYVNEEYADDSIWRFVAGRCVFFVL